jgi:hypothetical protein
MVLAVRPAQRSDGNPVRTHEGTTLKELFYRKSDEVTFPTVGDQRSQGQVNATEVS